MPQPNLNNVTLDLDAEIAKLLAQFGYWRMALAVASSVLRPKSRPPDATQILNDHLLKDLGLPPNTPPSERWPKGRF